MVRTPIPWLVVCGLGFRICVNLFTISESVVFLRASFVDRYGNR
jgi:hypothetical protein